MNAGRMGVRPDDEQIENVVCFRYLGSQVAVDEGYEIDVEHRMNEVCQACGALNVF